MGDNVGYGKHGSAMEADYPLTPSERKHLVRMMARGSLTKSMVLYSPNFSLSSKRYIVANLSERDNGRPEGKEEGGE